MTDCDLTGINIASSAPGNALDDVDDPTLEYFNLNSVVTGDERFKRSSKIDAILAQVGDERFWEYIINPISSIDVLYCQTIDFDFAQMGIQCWYWIYNHEKNRL